MCSRKIHVPFNKYKQNNGRSIAGPVLTAREHKIIPHSKNLSYGPSGFRGKTSLKIFIFERFSCHGRQNPNYIQTLVTHLTKLHARNSSFEFQRITLWLGDVLQRVSNLNICILGLGFTSEKAFEQILLKCMD